MSTVFETCSAQFPNTTGELPSLLQCIADGNENKALASYADGLLSKGTTAFLFTLLGALVFMMQTGFAMLCAGSIRAKNVKNVILWNLLDSCGGGLAFWAVGFAFAFGGDNKNPVFSFIGNTAFFVNTNSGVPLESFFFQFTFACALSSIVAGTIAERTQMKAYLMYSSFLVGFVYPVVAHALWSSNGFLSIYATAPLWGSGAIDLAGSGAVHMTGGVAALVGGYILGPRIGRFYDRDGVPLDEPAEFPAHSVALQFLGTFLLWFGWYGFNPGATLYLTSPVLGQVAALVTVNTTLSACAGAVSAMFTSSFFDWRRTGVFTYDVVYTMNGCLTGLVAITSGCATVETWAAVVIGMVAGWIYLGASKLLIRLRFDDAVDAVPVHMFGGMWGMIATGLFTAPGLLEKAYLVNKHFGWFYEWGVGSGDFTLIGIQLIAVLFIFGWTFVVMGFWFYMINYFGWFRVDSLEEEAGLDLSRHKGAAYDIMGVSEDTVQKLSVRRQSERQLFIDSSGKSRGSQGSGKPRNDGTTNKEDVENGEENADGANNDKEASA